MATVYAKPGEKKAFSGGADILICDLSEDGEYPVRAPSKVQVTSEGFLFNAATVTARGYNTTTYDPITVSDAISCILIGNEGNKLGSVKISGVAAGSHYVTFLPSD